MTRDINADWQPHVARHGRHLLHLPSRQAGAGEYLVQRTGPAARAAAWLGNPAGQNQPARAGGPGLAALRPVDAVPRAAQGRRHPRGLRHGAARRATGSSIKQTEWTYGLMMHMSESLGVNCTYCHNSRSFRDWNQSSPPRATAWHGIQMVRDLNAELPGPAARRLPRATAWARSATRPKVACSTCHAGVYKPLYGASMLKDYPELAKAGGITGVPVQPASPVVPEPGPAQVPGAEGQPPASGQPAQ